MLDAKVAVLEGALSERTDLPPLAPISATGPEEVTIVSRVCCEGGGGKLNKKLIYLEGSRTTSNALRVRHDVVSACPELAPLRGQVVGAVGVHSVGHSAKRILPALPPAASARPSAQVIKSDDGDQRLLVQVIADDSSTLLADLLRSGVEATVRHRGEHRTAGHTPPRSHKPCALTEYCVAPARPQYVHKRLEGTFAWVPPSPERPHLFTDMTAICLAAMYGSQQSLRLLLDAGANPDVRAVARVLSSDGKSSSSLPCNPLTPLVAAIWFDSKHACLQPLLQAGAALTAHCLYVRSPSSRNKGHPESQPPRPCRATSAVSRSRIHTLLGAKPDPILTLAQILTLTLARTLPSPPSLLTLHPLTHTLTLTLTLTSRRPPSPLTLTLTSARSEDGCRRGHQGADAFSFAHQLSSPHQQRPGMPALPSHSRGASRDPLAYSRAVRRLGCVGVRARATVRVGSGLESRLGSVLGVRVGVSAGVTAGVRAGVSTWVGVGVRGGCLLPHESPRTVPSPPGLS